MKVLDVKWFNSVGIVKAEDEYDGIKYYIRHIDGYNERQPIHGYCLCWVCLLKYWTLSGSKVI